MNPFSIYHLCPEGFPRFQQQLTDVIIKTTTPDMIFLLGAMLHRKRSESIFNESAPYSQQLSDCTLLILLPNLANKELHEWQDKIENHCGAILPVTTLVLATPTFVEWLQACLPFALSVWRHAPVLYDTGHICREDIPELKAPISNKDAIKQWEDGLSKAREFLAGAELYRVRKQHKMAAFMLHQSAEQALRALLKAGTGYHANTHSIDRLLRYSSLVAHQLPEIFPRQTEQDKRLFNLLQKAYIDTRYKEDYKITDEELLTLTGKVRCVHELLSDARNCFKNAPLQSELQNTSQ
ncbi:HEPN domain-containing protein [Niabella drilacis]|uniref:HEPN domain-containing protein n=2 Tax=Niabella drilacis (strain DSM 25811 / CCM 8410 / CCUG 62505 / LMG 26954 / E90) TaxID=1285928 RepID=A0A1G6XIX0_NIADE|nr:HEPN domain-containing protein [Niabella drilacis]